MIARPLCIGVSLLMLCSVATGKDTGRQHLYFQAIRRKDVSLLKDLIRRGTPLDVRRSDGTTPLMDAALHGSPQMVELLLSHAADARAARDDGVTPLLCGATEPEKVRLLVAHGADVNAKSALGNTPLMVAAGSPRGSASVECLLAHGADITLRNKRGRTALRFACDGGDIATVRLLLAKARELDKLEEVIDAAGPSVAVAAGNGYDAIVEVLLEHGADPNRENGSRGHGLNAALLSGETQIARDLILAGSDLGRRIQPGDVPTSLLAAYTEPGDTSSLIALLHERGGDCTAVNDQSETALTWARMRGHGDLIKTLVNIDVPEGEMPEKPSIPSRSIDLHAGSEADLIARAVQKSLNLLQLSSDSFLEVRGNCVSCHHQNLPGVAIAWARDRGFSVRQATIERMIERQVKSWQPRLDRAYQLDAPFPVPPRFLGWGMWSFAELGYPADELTRAVSWYLAATQQPDGRWVPGMLRPPMGDGEILATALAMRSLQFYPHSSREGEVAERIDRARKWLREAEPRTHQEIVFRVLGLAWAGAAPEDLAPDVRTLLDMQRDDGGWAQLPNLQSDAWATGQTLVALHTAGGVPTIDPAYRRGVEMLLETQFDDGSWYVQSRSWPFQPYFESKFPFGRDQWISAAGTAWAVMALVLAVDPDEVPTIEVPRPDALATAPQGRESTPLSATSPAQLVPPAARQVDFAKDIQPLFTRSCLGCHGDNDPEANFSLTSRASLLRGGDSELPAIVPGTSEDSPLVRFAADLEREVQMPPLDARDKYPPLSADEIALLRAWIDQGGNWESSKTGAR